MQKITRSLATPGRIGPRSSTRASTAAQLRARATNAGPVVPAGPERLNMSRIRNTKPAIYPAHEEWARANGYRPQAPSLKHQANRSKRRKPQAPSYKPQA